MKNIILILSLFLNSICFGQKEEIELPKSNGFTVKYSDKGITPLFSIYINKKGEVHLEDIKIPVEQLGDSLFKHSRNLRDDLIVWLITLIHADKNTPYRYVEKVKSQMSSALLLKAVYRTGHINDINSGLIVRLEDKSLIPRKEHPRSETSETTTYKELGIVRGPIFQMIDDFYNLKFSNAKKILNSYSYKKVTYYHKKRLKINNKKYKFKYKEKIYNELKNTDFVLIFPYPKMCYTTYLKNLFTLTSIYKKHKKPIAFIEISSDLQKILKKNNIKL